MSADPEVWLPRLEAQLRRDAGDLRVLGVRRLPGGACQDNFVVETTVDGVRSRFVLRSDAAVSLPGSLDRRREFEVIGAAVDAGVPTPAARGLFRDLLREGSSAYLMDFVEGVAIGGTVTRDPRLEAARALLPGQLARALAAIHAITPDRAPRLLLDTPQSAVDGRTPVDAALHFCRVMMASMVEPHPALELALAWLDGHRPADGERVLVHGDFRTGNFLVGPSGLEAILDWEFAHWGAPASDLAWLSLRDWRFGRPDLPIGGFARRDAFYAAYEAASGRAVDPTEVRWWEVMGNVRWAAGAVYQCERVLSGQEQDLELLAIGRRVAEMEYEALRLIAMGGSCRTDLTRPSS